MGTLYEHNIVIFLCFYLICDCILYMVYVDGHGKPIHQPSDSISFLKECDSR